MLRQRFPLGALRGRAGLLAPAPAGAQYPVGDRATPMTAGRSYTESYGPGYTAYVPVRDLRRELQLLPRQVHRRLPPQPVRLDQRLLRDDGVRLLAHADDLAQLPGDLRLVHPGAVQ